MQEARSLFKRTAKAFSLNSIVDVRLRRRRRHEMIFFNISETIGDSDFKNYDRVALDSLYILTGNDIINYFRSAANRTKHVNFSAIFGSRFLNNGSTDSKKVYSF